MTKEIKNLINYDEIITKAMKNALYDIFKKVEEEGNIGEHYFVISFWTKHKDVVLSKKIKNIYPEEMTIILQHQFNDLKTKEIGFEVELSFSGISEVIFIPYDSITSFSDPSVNFKLSFDEEDGDFFEDEEDFEEDAFFENEAEIGDGNNLIDFDLLLKNKK